MKYLVRIKKRVTYPRAYSIKERVGERENFMTRIFTRLFNRKPKDEVLPG